MPEAQHHILVVDDDDQVRRMLRRCFEDEGYRVSEAVDQAGVTLALGNGIDLITLDLNLGGADGLSIARTVRQSWDLPIIMITGKGDMIDRIVGLEIGADDYLAKPCNPRELVARARAVLRRARDTEGAAPGDSVRFAGFRLDIARRELIDPDDVVIPLSAGEFRLLRAFVERPQRVLTREQLLDYAFDNDADVFDRAVDVQVSRLRRKLERPGGPEIIRTVRGEGYLFAVKPTA